MPVKLGRYPAPVEVDIGDVLLVKKPMTDKATKKPFIWRFFGVVVERRFHTVRLIRLGGDEGRDETWVYLRSKDYELLYLKPDEWPDGVHAFRMRLILEGRLEGIV